MVAYLTKMVLINTMMMILVSALEKYTMHQNLVEISVASDPFTLAFHLHLYRKVQSELSFICVIGL